VKVVKPMKFIIEESVLDGDRVRKTGPSNGVYESLVESGRIARTRHHGQIV
jgi:hypothetical protein